MGLQGLVTFGSALAGDVLSVFSIPGGNTLASVAGAFMERRISEAREILIAEIAEGKVEFEEGDVDPLISILLRFSKAVEDGAAKQNLELLAKVIVGLKRNKALSGDAFNRWAGIIAHVTRDEILAIGIAIKLSRDGIGDEAESTNTFWQDYKNALESAGFTSSQVFAICASVSRYGLLIPISGWGSILYRPSDWLTDLDKLADFTKVT